MSGHIFVWTFGDTVEVVMLALAVIFFAGGLTYLFMDIQVELWRARQELRRLREEKDA